MKLTEIRQRKQDRIDESNRMAGLVLAFACSAVSIFAILITRAYFAQ